MLFKLILIIFHLRDISKYFRIMLRRRLNSTIKGVKLSFKSKCLAQVTKYLLFLQILVSTLYYLSAPFNLTFFIYLFWSINFCAVIYLLINANKLYAPLLQPLKRARLVFTATLVLLEITINLNTNSYAADNFHGLVSDVEVLITGIILGVLWFHNITAPIKKKIN